MKKIFTLFSAIIVSSLILKLNAQEIKPKIDETKALNKLENIFIKSEVITTPLSGEVITNENTVKWATTVRSRFSRKHYTEEIRKIKEEKNLLKQTSQKANGENIDDAAGEKTTAPTIGTNFEANWSYYGAPPDNTIAISNSGYIVTANNDGIEYYDESGNAIYSEYWEDFFNDGSLTDMLFDPRVIYDSEADRFFLVVLHGSTSTKSKVIICFSKSNNPGDGWWTYKLTGNPYSNSCWFDYPNIGYSTNEVYVSGNLFSDSDYYNRTVLYQIPKDACYAGGTVNWQYWSTTQAFTLVPASYGVEGSYGPGIYLVSSDAGGNSSITLWNLTDDMSGNPALNGYTVSTSSYSPSGDASQLGTSDLLDNGDCRIQNAFYMEGILQYTLHTDIGGGWNGIMYNRLKIASLENQSQTFGSQGNYDYSYPSIAAYATSSYHQGVMIAFLRSSSAIYPELRVVAVDEANQWSPSVQVKAGETFINWGSGSERWGDYTGIARRHNSASGRVWLAGCYGAKIYGYDTYKTWVAEIYSSATAKLEEKNNIQNAVIYPIPVYDLMNISFNIDEREEVTIDICDASGKIVKLLYKGTPKTGENLLTFNRGALNSGIYFVTIKTNSKIIKNEKIIIAD